MGRPGYFYDIAICILLGVLLLASSVSAWDGPDIVIQHPTEGTVIGGSEVNVSGTAANGTHNWWRHNGREELERGSFTDTAVDENGVALSVGGIAPKYGGCSETGSATSYISYTQGDLSDSSEATFEMWIYFEEKPTDETVLFESFHYSGSLRLGLAYIKLIGQHNYILFTYMPAGSSVWIPITATLPEARRWHHISCSYGSFGETISVDGNLSVLYYKTSPGRATDEMSLGHHMTTRPINTSKVYVDEFRVSMGQRYKSDFTPPTGPFTADSDTIILDHFDGSTVGSNNGWTLHEMETSGDYVSPVYGTGSLEPAIYSIGWTADVPQGTTMTMFLRHASTWDMASASEWQEVTSGSLMGARMHRYIQYKLHMERSVLDTPRFLGFAMEYGGVQFVRASLDGDNWIDTTGTENWSVSMSVPEGVVTVYIMALDVAYSISFAQVTFIVDQTPPTGYIRLAQGEDYTKDTQVNVQIFLDDPSTAQYMMVSRNPDFIDGEWVPFRKSFLTDLGTTEGEVTVHVKVREVGGLVSTTMSDSIILDRTPPTGEIVLGDGTGFSLGPTVTLHSTITDINGVTGMRTSLTDDFEGVAWDPYGEEYGLTISGEEGLRSVNCQYIDPAGNVLELLAQIVIDLMAPTVRVELAGGEEFVSVRYIMAVVEAMDANGIASMRTGSDPDELKNAKWGPFNSTYAIDLGTSDGKHVEWVEVMDPYGNTQLATASVTLDVTSPTGRLVIEGGGWIVLDQKVILSIEVWDVTSGVQGIRLSNDPSFTGVEFMEPAGSMVWILLSGEGNRTVYMEVVDHVGNGVVVNATIYLHTERPTGSISVSEELVASRDLIVELECDGAVEVAIYEEPADVMNWSPLERTVTLFLSPGDGTKTVCAIFRDEFTLTSEPSVVEVVLDSTPPEVMVTEPVANSVVESKRVTFAGTASDANGIVYIEMRLDDGDWVIAPSTTSWSNVLDLDDWGDHTLWVRAVDSAGNLAQIETSFSASERIEVQSSRTDWWIFILIIMALIIVVVILALRMRESQGQ